MKYYLFFLIGILQFTSNVSGENRAVMTFSNKIFEFNTSHFTHKSNIRIRYFFKNTGNAPLVIYKVATTCGCTIPQWPKKPIAPGSSGNLIVIFKYETDIAIIHKTLFVECNTKEKEVVLHIIGHKY